MKQQLVKGPFEKVEVKRNTDFTINKKLWRGWSEEQKRLFELVYQDAVDSQKIMKHPKGPLLNKEHWETLVHNFSYFAAANLRELEIEKDVKNAA